MASAAAAAAYTHTCHADDARELSKDEKVLATPWLYMGPVKTYEVHQPIPGFEVTETDNIGLVLMKQRNIALFTLFSELLDNAADEAWRNPATTKIVVRVSADTGVISVWNNGTGMTTDINRQTGLHFPHMVFGRMDAGTNFGTDRKDAITGMHGVGATLCNIASETFDIDIVDWVKKVRYRQQWKENKKVVSDPRITALSAKDAARKRPAGYTSVRMKLDCSILEDVVLPFHADFMSEFSSRVITTAVSLVDLNRKVEIEYNDKVVPIKTWASFVSDLGPVVFSSAPSTDKASMHLSVIGLTTEQAELSSLPNIIGIVNGKIVNEGLIHNALLTRLGKTVLDGMTAQNREAYTTSTKSMTLINTHFRVVFSLRIIQEHIRWNAQTKDKLMTALKEVGLDDITFGNPRRFLTSAAGASLVETLNGFQLGKAMRTIKAKSKTARTRSVDVENLRDASKAGTKKNQGTTLIMCEGATAQAFADTLAVHLPGGLDCNGSFHVGGKPICPDSSNLTRVLANKHIQGMIAALGISLEADYTQDSEYNKLRYQNILLLTDQDADGTHIKLLLLRLFQFLFPKLLERWVSDKRLKVMVTPIISVVPVGSVVPTAEFFTKEAFNEWEETHRVDESKQQVLYRKGVGAWSKPDAKRFMAHASRYIHPIITTAETGAAMDMFFSQATEHKDARKEAMQLASTRSNTIKYDSIAPGKPITVDAIIHEDGMAFCLVSLNRCTPHIVDGLKYSERLVVWYMLKKYANGAKKKVDSLQGEIAIATAYPHGQVSLPVVALGQANPGSGNNIPLVHGHGAFGSQANKISPQLRYIHASIPKATLALFPPADLPVLPMVDQDGEAEIPAFMAPVVPLILMQSTRGSGKGWAPFWMPRNPIAVIVAAQITVKALQAEEKEGVVIPADFIRSTDGSFAEKLVTPWYAMNDAIMTSRNGGKAFKWYGRLLFEPTVGAGSGSGSGSGSIIKAHVLSIPPHNYIQQVVDSIRAGMKAGWIVDYVNRTEGNVHIEISFRDSPELAALMDDSTEPKHQKLLEFLGMATAATSHDRIGSQHAFNKVEPELETYDTVEKILLDWGKARKDIYRARIARMIEVTRHKLALVAAKSRFIQMRVEKMLPFDGKTKDETVSILQEASFPVFDGSYKYLLKDIPIGATTMEQAAKYHRQAEETQAELDRLLSTDIHDVWMEEIELFKAEAEAWMEEQRRIFEWKPNFVRTQSASLVDTVPLTATVSVASAAATAAAAASKPPAAAVSGSKRKNRIGSPSLSVSSKSGPKRSKQSVPKK